MADEKTVNLRVDGSQGEQALDGIERAADGAAEAMGGLGVEIEKTETQTKRLAGTSRDYNNAARSVGDSVQAITRFEAAYRASLNDSANSAQVRAQILAASFARTIGGAADEARAAQLLAAGHEKAATAVQFIVQQQAMLAAETQAVSQADTVAAAVAASNAAIRVNAIQKAADAARQAARDQSLSYLDGASPSGGKSAGASAGIFAAAFREEEAAAKSAAQTLVARERALNENIRIAVKWEAMLEAEARAARDAAAAEAQLAQRTQVLVATYAPAVVQAERLAQAERELTTLIAAGTGPVGAYTAALRGVQAEKLAMTVASGHAARGFGQMGMAVQQAGYQVADMANQIGNGTPVYVAAGQQMGQLLGIFGAWGAVAGAAVSIAGPLAASFLKTGDASKDAEDAAKTYKDALGELVKLEKDYNAALRERSGLSADPGGTDSIDRRIREAEGRLRALPEKKTSFLGGVADSAMGAVGLGGDKTEYEKAHAELRAAIADKQAANDLAEAAGKARLARVVGDLGKERAEEAAIMRLSEKEREKATAALEAERQVRSALKDTAATSDEVDAQVAVARAHAQTAVALKAGEVAAKAYAEAQGKISAAAIEMKANLALNGLDGERAALSPAAATRGNISSGRTGPGHRDC